MKTNTINRNLSVSGNAPINYPADIFFAVLWQNEEDALGIQPLHPFCGEWGCPLSIQLTTEDVTVLPQTIDIVWLSVVERKFYSILQPLPIEQLKVLFQLFYREQSKEDLEEEDDNSDSFEYVYDSIVVGMAPYGSLALWTYGQKKSTIVVWIQGESIHVGMEDFMPHNPTITLNELCDYYINDNTKIKENLEKNGLPPRDLFDRYMQQFSYRYVVEFGHWDEEKKEWKDYEGEEVKPEFEYIEEALYDGTHDKLHDGGLMQYHPAGKPKKLALQYHIKKSVYSAYLWFEDFKIRAAFENFYHEYPDAEMDFLFRIDPEKNIYHILFTCKEAEQPLPLNEEAYQMIVFKSKFERYRTKNYNQPRGAWIW